MESHRADCSNVFITDKTNDGKAPSLFTFKVTGYDNKGDIDDYKLDFGDGITTTDDDQIFEHEYDEAGTYHVRGYIRNSEGEWVGGDDGCSINAFVKTKSLTKQPDTGTPTAFTFIGLFSGGTGAALAFVRRKMLS